MRNRADRPQRWFRLRMRAPRDVISWLRWALDFKHRREVNAYLRGVEVKLETMFDQREFTRMSVELVTQGRTEIAFHPYPHAEPQT